ncbi:MAG: hypothetical protein GF334_00055 [Candidatus Altiarchaeales archaeon]|nr:hypothetical protein [Candidatus Altiarchaeales archaeon]
MDNKTKAMGLGLTALLVFGLVLAVNANTEEMMDVGCGNHPQHGFHMRGGMGRPHFKLTELGLPEDATHEDVRQALWEKRLSDLGLTEESTVGQYHNALVARNRERRNQMLFELGLDEDATDEQMREAHKKRREENPQECPCKGGRGFRQRLMRD